MLFSEKATTHFLRICQQKAGEPREMSKTRVDQAKGDNFYSTFFKLLQPYSSPGAVYSGVLSPDTGLKAIPNEKEV